MGCCPDVTNQYYDEDGILQESTDGGVTYHPAPDDPRFNAPLAPPLTSAVGEDRRCEAANNVTGYFKARADELIADSDAWGGVTALLAAVAAIVVLLLSLGTGAGITALLLGLTAALLAGGSSAFNAAMTTEVYSDFCCIVYCHTPDDGVYTVASWQAIKSEINAKFTGIAQKFLHDIMNAGGLVTLINASRSGVNAGLSCAGCECGCDEGCEPTFEAYQWNDVRWTTHGEYRRFSAFTPPGSFDCFEMGTSDAVLTLDSEQCITYVSIVVNNGCPFPDGAEIKLYIDGISYGLKEPLDKAPTDPTGCLDPSAFWEIPNGASGSTLRFEQVGTHCVGGDDNRLICVRVGRCP